MISVIFMFLLRTAPWAAMGVSLWIMIAKDRRIVLMDLAFWALFFLDYVFPIPHKIVLAIAVMYICFGVWAAIIPERIYLEKHRRTWFKKWFMHPMEFIGYKVFAGFFKLLPLTWTSWFFGKIMRYLAPLANANKIAQRNLEYVMPELNNKEFLGNLWENWGRAFGEGLHSRTYMKHQDKYIKYENKKLLDEANKSAPYFVAMMHNGYMGLFAIPFQKFQKTSGIVYRFPNNPLMDKALQENFGDGLAKIEFIPKGQARMIIRRLQDGGVVAITPDHRADEGEKLTFFGKPAMTSTGITRLARKFNCDILVAHVERTHGVYHKIVFDKIVKVPHTDDAVRDEINGMQEVNDIMEQVIRKNPSEWLWMHTRWGKRILKNG